MNKKQMLSPKLDVVFHMIFGEQKNERITRKLIEDVIQEKVETIELNQTPYLLGDQVNDKVGIIDIRAKINDQDLVNIEMQIMNNKDIEKRVLYYWAKLYSRQLKRGEKYTKLERCISIIFIDYELEKLKELPIHTTWKIKSEKNSKIILTKDLEIHIIELPKIKKKLDNEHLKKWILFLENPEGEETKKMAEKEIEIKEAIDTLEEITDDEQKYRIAELRHKYILDRNSEMETAREIGLQEGREQGIKEGRFQGIKEGRKEGRQEGRQEAIKRTVIRMLEEKMEISMIEKITKLTKVEIEKIKIESGIKR